MSSKKRIIACALEDTFLKKSNQHSSIEGNILEKISKGQEITFTKKKGNDEHLEVRYIKTENNDKIIPKAYIWNASWKIKE